MKPRSGLNLALNSEPVTTLDKVKDEYLGKVKTYKVEEKNELEAMRRAIESILTKIHSMDQFMRGQIYSYKAKVMDGEEYKKTVIKEFLEDMRNGKYTQDQLKLLTGESK